MKSPPPKKKPVNFISWFEIPASNFERAVQFYNSIFDIQLETETMNGYSMAFFPSSSGVGGAIICGEGSEPSQKGSLLYLNGGEDLNEVLFKVEDAGGKVILHKQKINDENGYFALFIDTEGNKLALHSNS